MDLVIGNPAGWWALLGIPAVLLIHLLQHEARRYPASTLFLVEHLARQSTEGRLLERIRHSASLWLQLLAVVLLTWLLLQPRWLRADSFQRVVVVLDSSASMQAFRDRVPEAMADALPRLDRAAARTEWRLIETDPGRPGLYAGTRPADLLAALDRWHPRLGMHALDPALRQARSLAGAGGSIVLVTDHEPDPRPDGIDLLAVGAPLANVGFAGVRVEPDPGGDGAAWTAVVRNHADVPQQRTWTAAWGDVRSSPEVLRLGPGALLTLRGTFPDGADTFRLELEADAFALDDRLPLVRPRPKPLRVAVQVGETGAAFADRFLSSLRDVERVPRSGQPDLELLAYTPGVIPALVANAICLPRPGAAPAAEAAGPVVAEPHELVDGLSWQGLLCRPGPAPDLTGDDQALVWMGGQPLVFLRSRGGLRQLVVAFDLAGSNATRLPAFVVLLHRFAESVRAAVPVFTACNLECNQLLPLAVDPGGGPVERVADGAVAEALPAARAHLLRAPPDPGLFRVRQDGRDLLLASARFADIREADFRTAAAAADLRPRADLVARRNSRPDPLAPLWTLLVLAAAAGAWAWRSPAG